MLNYIIIVAGGKGTRMGVELPKQFISLSGRPILMHTIEAFYNYDKLTNIILVLPQDQLSFWEELCRQYSFKIPHTIATGGANRFDSVKNGLQFVPEKDAVVGIHDGVRPLVSKEIIKNCFEKAKKYGAVFPCIPVIDTLREKTPTGYITVDRSAYSLVQTPQVFLSEIIKKAYNQSYSVSFTDDVSVVESLGENKVYEVEGSRENIKITTPLDLIIAEAILGT